MNTLQNAVQEACKQPTLLDALTHICIWEAERVVVQARKNPTWETCFRVCLDSVMKEWAKRAVMIKVILYPCPCCTTWNVSEWVYTGDKIIKREHITEFPTIDDARKVYQQVLGELIESIYDPKTDSYSNRDNPNANFIVQGSHGYCHQCRRKTE